MKYKLFKKLLIDRIEAIYCYNNISQLPKDLRVALSKPHKVIGKQYKFERIIQ